MNIRTKLLKSTLSIAAVILAVSLACSATGLSPAFSTQVAQTVQAQLHSTQAVDEIATMVAATIIASGGTPPPPATEPPPAGASPTPEPGSTQEPGSTPEPIEPIISLDDGSQQVDFNGDGYTDLVVGIPGLADGDAPGVGGFYIFLGSQGGILNGKLQVWPGREILPFAVENSSLGAFNAVGDFDGDGFSDLALGYPPGTNNDGSGMVVLLYGSAGGITTDRLELWDQDASLKEGEGLTPGTLGGVEPGDAFGTSLASGDFNADGYDDLAVGAPGEDLETGLNQGVVHVLYGSPTGLTHVGNALLHQNGFFIEQDDQALQIGDLIAGAEAGDEFGTSLAVGDINGDSFDDLVVGAPREAIGDIESAGVVHVIYGSASGLVPAGNQHPHESGFYTDTDGDGGVDQNIEGGLFGEPETFGVFGTALAVADVNGDGFGDLAVGAPGHSANNLQAAGVVHIIFGSAGGLTIENSQVWNQQFSTRIDGETLPGLLAGGEPEEFDQFGYSLLAADFNMDGFADLAVGSGSESLGADDFSGAVSVLYGTPTGPVADGSQWASLFDSIDRSGNQGPGLVGGPQAEAGFGSVFTAGDYNADGVQDLVIGAPSLRVNDANRAGAFYILFGTLGTGLNLAGWEQWTIAGATNSTGQIIANLDGSPEELDLFGFGLR